MAPSFIFAKFTSGIMERQFTAALIFCPARTNIFERSCSYERTRKKV